jgi:hypothetical protein
MKFKAAAGPYCCISYINRSITILDIIHRPIFYLEQKVSETGFCLRLQVEPIQLGPIDRAGPCLRTQRL